MRAAALAPGSKEVEDLRRAILAEHQNESTLQTLKRALDLEDYRAVLRGASGFPRGSVYRERAQALAEAARANLVVQHLNAGERWRNQGDCRAANREAESALRLEAGNPAAQALIAACPRMAMARPGFGRSQRLAVRNQPLAAARNQPLADPPEPPARRIVAREPVEAPPPALLGPPPERPNRRPIDPNNPYAGDLP